jgi:hypothetical protein
MACSIQILHVNGIVPPPPGGPNPTQLRVMGQASGCPGNTVIIQSSITAQSGPIPVDPATNRFVATLPITVSPPPVCGDPNNPVTVEAWCQQLPPPGPPSPCYDSYQGPLTCCEVISLSFSAFVPVGSLDPTEIRVQGVLLGCSGDKVVAVAPSFTGQSMATPVDPMTGAFFISLPITAGVSLQCGTRITVKAWCDSNPLGCQTDRTDVLDCGPCPRAKVSIHQPLPACTGTPPTQLITLDTSIEIPANAIYVFQWDFGDSNRGTQFTVNNTGGTPSTPYSHSESHNYIPGSYTAKLLVISPTPPETCPTSFPLTVLVQCLPDCPTATVVRVSEGPCVNGKRTVTLEATVTAPASSAAVGQWDFGYAPPGGSSVGPQIGVPQGQTQSPSQNSALRQTWDYPPGTYTACLKWNNAIHPGCADSCVSFTVSTCPPPPPPVCDVHLTYLPKPVPCLPPGQSVTVNFEATPNATTTPAYTGPYTWEVSQAGASIKKLTQQSPTTPDPYKFSYTFTSPGTYEITVTILTPNCPDPTDTDVVSLTIKSCCPTFVGQLNAQQDPNNPCQWFFSVQVDNPNNVPLTFDWSFQDGTTQQTSIPSTSHTYAPGTITTGQTRVTMHAAGCPDVTLSTTVTLSCTCPTVSAPSAVVTGCAPGSASVTLSTSVSPPVATSFDWTVTTPGGTPFTKTTTAPTTTDGTSDGSWTNTVAGSTGPLDLSAPGAYAIAVNAKGPAIPPTCPTPAPTGFTIPKCTGMTEGLGCMLLRWAAVILFILSGLAFIISFCVFSPPVCTFQFCQQAATAAFWIGVGFALAGLVVLGIWLLFCPTKPCAWGWLIAGQVLLGVGLVALHFTKCCPQLWIFGVFFTVLGILSFANWVRLCKIGPCTAARELAVVFVSVVAPIIAWAGVGGPVALCINTTVRGIVATVGGAISLFALGCTPP